MMKRIIVTRFSAMGDVAMLASVLKEFQLQHNDTEIIIVSRPAFKAFFNDIPRLIFHEIFPDGLHKGFFGLVKLFNELSSYKATYLADLHNNLRSTVLRVLFSFGAIKTAHLNKGRSEKKALIQHKLHRQLQLTTERYADVFRKLGFSFDLTHQLRKENRQIPTEFQHLFALPNKKIGIAPFAQHPYKVWSLQKMEEVISYLSTNGYNVFIFGGGAVEKEKAETWAKEFANVHSTINRLNIQKELDIIANLDLMISMDSSGMHMASLVGTRCLSVWGATHPFAGFLGYGQSYEDCIQVAHPNRPSSIYGNKPCNCDGVEAIDMVSPEQVINQIKKICE
ncbi:MAG: heptosyltransferase [Chitinophagaceae bacterium]|nr:MAG: heptosyltransferase [Chitinophagaceae bacterium]